MNLSFALQVILALILVSGVVSYMGNYVGRFFGRRRLSLFGLRPRYTATIFTIISGILIAILTFFTVIVISRDARVAIFGLEKLRAEIRTARSDLSANKKELKDKIAEIDKVKKELEGVKLGLKKLEEMRVRLKSEVQTLTSQKILFSAGEDVYIVKLKGGVGAQRSEAALRKMLSELDAAMKKYKINEIQVDPGDFDSTVSFLANYQDEVVVRLLSLRNVTLGGDLPVKFEVQPNQLIFKKGEEVARLDISSKLTLPEIEEKIKALLSEAQYLGKSKGVLPDVTGSVGAIPYTDIYNTAKRIKGGNTMATVKLITKKDIYTIGPLELEFKTNI